MAAETGHAANRVYLDQAGAFHLNGAAFFDDSETDVSGQLETVVGAPTAGALVAGGTFVNSSGGITTVATGLSQILGASACILSTSALSTAAGIGFFCTVGYSTASGNLDVVAHKPTSTANFGDQIATSTGFSIGWTAFGA